MFFDPDVDTAYPQKWIGKVAVTTWDQRVFEQRLAHPKGDSQNPLSLDERLDTFRPLASFDNLREPDAIIDCAKKHCRGGIAFARLFSGYSEVSDYEEVSYLIRNSRRPILINRDGHDHPEGIMRTVSRRGLIFLILIVALQRFSGYQH
jgi:hypothetical protein